MTHDWSNLPKRLHYLCPAAEKYGVFQMHSELLELRRRLTAADRNELADVAASIQSKRDFGPIQDWLDKYPIDQHREAALVYWLLGVLDEFGLLEGGTDFGITMEAELRKAWETAHPTTFPSLLKQTVGRFSPAIERDCVLRGLERLAPHLLGMNLWLLHPYSDPRNLDWIESKCVDREYGEWGKLAAISGIDWEKVNVWLDRGRPLSDVAIDALTACFEWDTRGLKNYQPKLRSPGPMKVMRTRLMRHRAQESDPERAAAIDLVIQNLPAICGE